MPIHSCMNCQKKTEFKNGHCPYCFDTHDTCSTCGGPMAEYDNNMNEGKHCPKDCEFDIVVGDLQDELRDDSQTEQPPETFGEDDTVYNLPGSARTKQFLIACWNCKEEKIDPNKAIKDQVKIFGYICPDCGFSIREDPRLLISIGKRLGLTTDQERFRYLLEMVDDLKKIPK